MGAVLKLVENIEPEFGDGDGDYGEGFECPECENDEFEVYPGPYGVCTECGEEVDFNVEGDDTD